MCTLPGTSKKKKKKKKAKGSEGGGGEEGKDGKIMDISNYISCHNKMISSHCTHAHNTHSA
jgi:hypothetical protein